MSSFDRNVHEAFTRALDLPAAAWTKFLDETVSDERVRARVRRLLELHAGPGDVLEDATRSGSGPGGAGLRFGVFRVIREIGRGGMGVVYLAEDTVLKRLVALKTVSATSDPGGEVGERFRREAQAAARLRHPGIVPVYSTGETDGTLYIAMEYVPGVTLRERLGGGEGRGGRGEGAELGWSMPDRTGVMEAARIARDVADALEHAHRNKLIHRDVKPSNILIGEDGSVRLADFGIARLVDERTLTRAGDLAGSLAYMSPEQVRAQHAKIDHRTDIFSLGAVLYEMLTGRRPFAGETPAQLIAMMERDEVADVCGLNPQVPRDLSVVCHKAIEREPSQRYQSAAMVAAELGLVLAGQPIATRPPGVGRKVWQVVRRRRRGLAVAGVIALAGVGGWLGVEKVRADARTRGVVSILAAVPGEAARAWAVPLADGVEKDGTRGAGDEGRAIALGGLPVESRALKAGRYRFVVEGDGGRFTDFEDRVVAQGALRRVVRVVGDEVTQGMVRFEGGAMPAKYVIPGGTERTPAEATPSVAAFWMDEAEVSNEEFRAYVDAGLASAPAYWSKFDWGQIRQLPVVGLSRDEMQGYAVWMGKRLPSWAEWVGAAQAPDGRVHPWGSGEPPTDAIPPADARARTITTSIDVLERAYAELTAPVRSGETLRTPSGLYHMFGNVREMTGSEAVSAQAVTAVVAGSDWITDPRRNDVTAPILYPWEARGMVGFRCARSVRAPVVR